MAGTQADIFLRVLIGRKIPWQHRTIIRGRSNEANLKESIRFVSLKYADPIGFDNDLIARLLAKAFFDRRQ